MHGYDMLRMPTTMHVELIDRHIHHIFQVILSNNLVEFLIILEEVLELYLAIVLMIRFCLSGLTKEMEFHLISESAEI